MRISDWSSDVCSSDLRNTFKVSVRHSLQWMKQPLAAVVLFGRTGPLGADKAQRLRIVAITTDRSNAAIGTNGYDDPARRCTDPAKAALLMRFVDARHGSCPTASKR